MSEIRLKTKHLSEIDLKVGINSMYFINDELIMFDKKYLHSRLLLRNGYELISDDEEERSGRASCFFKKYIRFLLV